MMLYLCSLIASSQVLAGYLMRCGLLALVVSACCGQLGTAATLYGVTGDGAAKPESLFTLNDGNATANFLLGLGNGDDGETIAGNLFDGFLYHASGRLTQRFERINVNSSIVTDIPLSGETYDEAIGMTVANSSTLLVSDRVGGLFEVTTEGTVSKIGDMDHAAKGLAFSGPTLYSVSVTDLDDNPEAKLRQLDPSTGSTISTVDITVPGFSVENATGLATHPVTQELWALLKVADQSARLLVTLAPSTGQATLVGNTSRKFAGIAFLADGPPNAATWDGDNLAGNIGDGVTWSDANNWTVAGIQDTVPAAGPPGDDITFNSAPTVGTINLGGEQIVNSASFQADYTLTGGEIIVTSGIVTVDSGIRVTIDADIRGAEILTKIGDGQLLINGTAGDTIIESGTIGGTGILGNLSLVGNTILSPGGSSDVVSIGASLGSNRTKPLVLEADADGILERNVLVPEPATFVLAGAGWLVVIGARGRRATRVRNRSAVRSASKPHAKPKKDDSSRL